MSLNVVATPIGNPNDMSLRALNALKEADWIIGEEKKPLGQLISQLKIGPKSLDFLNEHSDHRDLEALMNLCRNHNVALVSDCGTPGFCDPGSQLVQLCRKENISVNIIPGASSLMVFLSGCGLRMDQFYFFGFLPAKAEERKDAISQFKKQRIPIILMDTPYRMSSTLEDLNKYLPERSVHIGMSLTQEDEKFDAGKPAQLLERYKGQKREFILAII
jgi:16S rRNA (cytidine1402-2'-O)-methyltransferase